MSDVARKPKPQFRNASPKTRELPERDANTNRPNGASRTHRTNRPEKTIPSSGSLKIARPSNQSIAMSVTELYKSYRKSNLEVPVLKGVNLQVREGEFTAIIGQSGSGKSTLLHLLGTLDAPDSGEIHFRDQRIDNLPTRKKDYLRNREFGMIFQFYHLLPELTTLENVLVPQMVKDNAWTYWRNKSTYQKRAEELLKSVGLGHRLHHKPSQLSGGEMQRTAIARALISAPSVLLADEPTGNLDAENGREVMDTLNSLRSHENLTVIMVTHDESLAATADNVIHLVNGRVE